MSSLSSEVSENETGLASLSNQVKINADDIASLSNHVDKNVKGLASLSNQVKINADDISTVSTDLANNYITISALNTQLTSTYIQQFEKLNFSVTNLDVGGSLTIDGVPIADIIANSQDSYEHPSDITLSGLTVEKIIGTGFPEYVTVEGSLIPSQDVWYQLGNPAFRWLEGHFGTIYAENLSVIDGAGNERRVLLDGAGIEYNTILNPPETVLPGDIGNYLPSWLTDLQSGAVVGGFSGEFPFDRISDVPSFLRADPILEAFKNNAKQGIGSLVARLINGTFAPRVAGYFFPDVAGATITAAKSRIYAYDAGNRIVTTVERNINFSTSSGRVVLAESGGAFGGFSGTTQIAWSVVLTVSTALTSDVEVSCFVERIADLASVDQTYYIGLHPEGSGGGTGTGDLPVWVAASQSAVNLSGFNQDILIGVPTWVADIQQDVLLASFGGSLSFSRLVDVPAPVSIPTWVQQEFQANVYVANFGGQFPWGRISDRPGIFTADWVTTLQGGVSIGGFGGNLDYSRIANKPTVPILPSWLKETQNQVNISGFNLDVDFTGPPGADGKDGTNGVDGVDGTNGTNGLPGADGKDGLNGTNGIDGKDGTNGTNGKDGVDGSDANVPLWVTSTQAEVLLANFGGQLDASRVNNLPSGGHAEWSTLTNRPEWTNHLAWENIGQYLINPEPENFDIVAYNSITPSDHKTYNLGQQGRRWAYVYADEVRCRGIGFFDTDPFQSTYFTGSYNELRDKPNIPTAPVLPDLSILDQLTFTPGTFGGQISVQGNRITNAAGPVDNLDLTNKAWVETAIDVAENNLYLTLSDEIQDAVPQWVKDAAYDNQNNRDLVSLNANLAVGQLRVNPVESLAGSDAGLVMGQSTFDESLMHRIIYMKPGRDDYDAVCKKQVPTRTSQLTNDSGFVSKTTALGLWFTNYGSRCPVKISIWGTSNSLSIASKVSIPFQPGSSPVFHKVDVIYRYFDRGGLDKKAESYGTLGLDSTRSDDALYAGNTLLNNLNTPIANGALSFSIIADVEYAGSRSEFVLKSNAVTNITSSVTDFVF